MYALRYITATNPAIKRFTGLTRQKLLVLESLSCLGCPCPYDRLHTVTKLRSCAITFRLFNELLAECVNDGLVVRSKAGKNVLYCITLKGRALIEAFGRELEAIVKADIMKYGNGLPE